MGTVVEREGSDMSSKREELRRMEGGEEEKEGVGGQQVSSSTGASLLSLFRRESGLLGTCSQNQRKHTRGHIEASSLSLSQLYNVFRFDPKTF